MKTARLLMWCDAENCWTPMNKEMLWGWVEGDLDMATDGDEFELRFKRSDMTDEEFDALPEQ